jgi:sugar phosphate isomerase/epimerase
MPAELPGVRLAGIGDEAAPDIDRQIEAHRRLGWDTIELRNIDGVPLAELDKAAFDKMAIAIAAAGLNVVCLDSRIANWARPISTDFELDAAELAALIPQCATLGTRYIRIMSYPGDGRNDVDWAREVKRRIRELALRAADAGVVLLHENCAGWAGADAMRMTELLAEVGSPALRLLFDIGNGVAYGYDAYDILRQVVDLVAHVHIKDAIGTVEAAHYVLPGTGDCRVAECLRLLLEHGYQGVWSIEPHLNVRPHDKQLDPGDDGLTDFVDYGRHLERLITDSALEPAWTG